jgi:hypothetical protein
MRTASILLALVVGLGFVREAGAEFVSTTRDCTIKIGDQWFGFADQWVNPAPQFPDATNDGRNCRYEDGLFTTMYIGPFGNRTVPFSATQGLVGFCLILVAFIALLVAVTVRRKRRHTTLADR